MEDVFFRIVQNTSKIFVFSIIVWQWNFSGLTLAHLPSKELAFAPTAINKTETPKEEQYEIAYRKVIPITAYSSTVDQCDSTPCITANGFNLCKHNQENVVAANFLPFNTKIRIPKHFGDRVFTVQDRMNARYYYRADLWMQTREKAKQWGIRNVEIEVLK